MQRNARNSSSKTWDHLGLSLVWYVAKTQTQNVFALLFLGQTENHPSASVAHNRKSEFEMLGQISLYLFYLLF